MPQLCICFTYCSCGHVLQACHLGHQCSQGPWFLVLPYICSPSPGGTWTRSVDKSSINAYIWAQKVINKVIKQSIGIVSTRNLRMSLQFLFAEQQTLITVSKINSERYTLSLWKCFITVILLVDKNVCNLHQRSTEGRSALTASDCCAQQACTAAGPQLALSSSSIFLDEQDA